MSDARLLGISYSWETGDGRLGGVGFGSAAGWVRVKVYVEQRWTSSDTPIGERVRRWSGPSIDVRPPDITTWRDDLIEFRLPATFVADTAEFQSKIAEQRRQVDADARFITVSAHVTEVHTVDGTVLHDDPGARPA